MLRLVIPISPEGWDESRQEFVESKVQVLELEHSLVALQAWESKWHKAFLSKKEKTEEETLDYIRCMTLTPNVDPDVYNHLTSENVKQINDYISNPMTATYFPQDQSSKNSREVTTAELIYYWMIALQIPVEFKNWHLNQLLTLIKVCNMKNAPAKKRSGRQLIQDYAAMNAARKKEWNSKG
jgi:hypothetical protein